MRTPAALLTAALLAPVSAPAFHDGGVACCSGRHTLHDSQDGAPPSSGSDRHAVRRQVPEAVDRGMDPPCLSSPP
jgi:hypothetical protein